MVGTNDRNEAKGGFSHLENTDEIDKAIDIPDLTLQNGEVSTKINKRLKSLKLSGDAIRKIGEVFVEEMDAALDGKPSSLQMENTYITKLLRGNENGEFLALDLGGTNFRVLFVELVNGQVVQECVEHYYISHELRVNTGIKLFDYLAECISQFLQKYNIVEKRLPLGFTFSFPMRQQALDSGILVTWTKSFKASGVENEDAAQLLRDAINRKGGIRVDVVAILNDTTGTFMQGALLDRNTAIGLILGTGCNACYIDKADNVKRWVTPRTTEREVVIDTEWGAFGDNGTLDFIKTEYDKLVDANSNFVHSFTFEKYIAGLYLGELVRIILAQLTKEKLLFNEEATKRLSDKDVFVTNYVSQIEHNTNFKYGVGTPHYFNVALHYSKPYLYDCDFEKRTVNYEHIHTRDSAYGVTDNTKTVLKNLGITDYSEDDVRVLQYICHIVSFRSALLVSICLAKLLLRIGRDNVTIAVDGSLYRHHPRLHKWIKQCIELLAPHKKLIMVSDGSGKGAALVACIAPKISK